MGSFRRPGGSGTLMASSDVVVPVAGVEPARPCGHGILSPGRLPIPPHRHNKSLVIIAYGRCVCKGKLFCKYYSFFEGDMIL